MFLADGAGQSQVLRSSVMPASAIADTMATSDRSGHYGRSTIECVVNISGECPLVVIGGDLGIPCWAIPLFLFLLMAREV
jgi:hypothetical protein